MSKYFTHLAASATLFLMPVAMVMAQTYKLDNNNTGRDFLISISNFINSAIIPFLLGVGFLVFVWGMFKYFIAGGADEDKRSEGKNLIVYAVVGFVLIFIFWGVVNLAVRFTGLEKNEIQGTLPKAVVPAGGGVK